jgi:hypothetical protein
MNISDKHARQERLAASRQARAARHADWQALMALPMFVAARLDKEEAQANAARGLLGQELPWHGADRPWYGADRLRERGFTRADAIFIAGHDPFRALREIAAMRKIINRYECAGAAAVVSTGAEKTAWEKIAAALKRDVIDVAAIWDGHPDYRPEWHPDL